MNIKKRIAYKFKYFIKFQPKSKFYVEIEKMCDYNVLDCNKFVIFKKDYLSHEEKEYQIS